MLSGAQDAEVRWVKTRKMIDSTYIYLDQCQRNFHCKFTNNPPSTRSDAPVTYLARSLPRKTTGPAISSGSVDKGEVCTNATAAIDSGLTAEAT